MCGLCCLGVGLTGPGLCGTGPGATGFGFGGGGGGGGGSGGATDAGGTLARGGCSGWLGLVKGGGGRCIGAGLLVGGKNLGVALVPGVVAVLSEHALLVAGSPGGGLLAGAAAGACFGWSGAGLFPGGTAGSGGGLLPAGRGFAGTDPGAAAEGGFANPGLFRGCGRRGFAFAGDPVLLPGGTAGSGGRCWPGGFDLLPSGAAAGGLPRGEGFGACSACFGGGGLHGPGGAACRMEKGLDMATSPGAGVVLGGPTFNGSGRLMGPVMVSHLPFTFTQFSPSHFSTFRQSPL